MKQINKSAFVNYLGEGFHTAFRKASDCPQAHPIWLLINEMPNKDWNSILTFVAEPLAELLEIELTE